MPEKKEKTYPRGARPANVVVEILDDRTGGVRYDEASVKERALSQLHFYHRSGLDGSDWHATHRSPSMPYL